MKDYRVVAKDALVQLVEQSEEYRMASDWMRANDRLCWEYTFRQAVRKLTRDDFTLDGAVQSVRNTLWVLSRNKFGHSLTPEQYNAVMSLFATGCIHEFQTIYGETFDVFEFDTFWSCFHGDASDEPEES